MHQEYNTPVDNEDKDAWVEYGQSLEQSFIETIVPILKLDIRMNPEKEWNPYAPDLLADGVRADLKTQNTPFFTSSRYGKDPSSTVSYNRKDQERYKSEYGNLPIYFYVRWAVLEYRGISARQVHGVWKTDTAAVDRLIAKGAAPLHTYKQRKDDRRGNAKSSYLLSLADLELVGNLGD